MKSCRGRPFGLAGRFSFALACLGLALAARPVLAAPGPGAAAQQPTQWPVLISRFAEVDRQTVASLGQSRLSQEAAMSILAGLPSSALGFSLGRLLEAGFGDELIRKASSAEAASQSYRLAVAGPSETDIIPYGYESKPDTLGAPVSLILGFYAADTDSEIRLLVLGYEVSAQGRAQDLFTAEATCRLADLPAAFDGIMPGLRTWATKDTTQSTPVIAAAQKAPDLLTDPGFSPIEWDGGEALAKARKRLDSSLSRLVISIPLTALAAGFLYQQIELNSRTGTYGTPFYASVAGMAAAGSLSVAFVIDTGVKIGQLVQASK